MSRWVKETGFLNEEGEKAMQGFKRALEELLNQPEAQAMSEGELRTLGCCLQNIVGNTMSNTIRTAKQNTGPLFSMTDEQFDKHLQDKYGADWMLKALEPDEMKRALLQASVVDLLKEVFQSEYIPLPQHGVRFPKGGPTYK